MTSDGAMHLDFPMWLRGAHYFDILFLSLSARSGLQILAAHPKLYWNDHCTPGTEWLRLTRKRMHGLGRDLALIVLGETTQAHASLAVAIGLVGLALVAAVHVVGTMYSRRRPELVYGGPGGDRRVPPAVDPHVLEAAEPLPGARSVVFDAFDDRSASEPDPAGAAGTTARWRSPSPGSPRRCSPTR